MIKVELEPGGPIVPYVHRLCLYPQLLSEAVNKAPHRILDDGLRRLVAVHWLGELGLLVDCRVARSTRDLRVGTFRVHQANVVLALWISRSLPAGTLGIDAGVQATLEAASRSFGVRLSGHPLQEPRHLYSGPWDGKWPFVFEQPRGSAPVAFGSLNPRNNSCELVWSVDLDRYLKWFERELRPTVETRVSLGPEQRCRAYAAILEELCGVDWLSSQRSLRSMRPGYSRWALCVSQFDQRFSQQSKSVEEVCQLMEIELDSQALIDATDGFRHSQRLGGLDRYGESSVVDRLRSMARSKGQFDDALLEVKCAAAHKSKGHDVVATERWGQPDLKITIPGWPLAVQVECKRRNRAASPKWLKRVVENANKQFGRSNVEAFGVLYLDISSVTVTLCSAEEVRRVVSEFERALRHLLRPGVYRSVSAAVLLFRDFSAPSVVPIPPDEWVPVLRQDSLIVRHAAPHRRLPFDTTPLDYGVTLLAGSWRAAP